MKDLEFNKIAASILVAGLIALVVGKVTNALYSPDEQEKRGYQVEVASGNEAGGAAAEAEKPLDIPALMAAANAENGQTIFKKCVSCHSVEKSGAHKVGPNLWGIIGLKSAHHADFAYSSALKEKNITWGYSELFAFLKKPSAYAPGTKMSFAGLRKPEEIADVIAYLRAQSDSPKPLP
jgi:cytochrome c